MRVIRYYVKNKVPFETWKKQVIYKALGIKTYPASILDVKYETLHSDENNIDLQHLWPILSIRKYR